METDPDILCVSHCYSVILDTYPPAFETTLEKHTMLNRSLVFAAALTLASYSVAAFAPLWPPVERPTQVRLFNNNNNHDVHPDDNDYGRIKQGTRRHALFTAILSISTVASEAQAEVIGAGRCANGEGEGCDSLADGNAYIQSLQRKSSENKEENQRVSFWHAV